MFYSFAPRGAKRFLDTKEVALLQNLIDFEHFPVGFEFAFTKEVLCIPRSPTEVAHKWNTRADTLVDNARSFADGVSIFAPLESCGGQWMVGRHTTVFKNGVRCRFNMR